MTHTCSSCGVKLRLKSPETNGKRQCPRCGAPLNLESAPNGSVSTRQLLIVGGGLAALLLPVGLLLALLLFAGGPGPDSPPARGDEGQSDDLRVAHVDP